MSNFAVLNNFFLISNLHSLLTPRINLFSMLHDQGLRRRPKHSHKHIVLLSDGQNKAASVSGALFEAIRYQRFVDEAVGAFCSGICRGGDLVQKSFPVRSRAFRAFSGSKPLYWGFPIRLRRKH